MSDSIKDIALQLDELLAKTNLSKVTASGAGFEDLDDGYYITSVSDLELKVNKNGNPMVSMKAKILEDGWHYDEPADTYTRVVGSKNRVIFKNWSLTNEQDVKRFVSDMLKFENPEKEGESLLQMVVEEGHDVMEYFSNTEFLLDALAIIKDFESHIYIQISSFEKNGERKTSQNLVKWSAIDEIANDYNLDM